MEIRRLMACMKPTNNKQNKNRNGSQYRNRIQNDTLMNLELIVEASANETSDSNVEVLP